MIHFHHPDFEYSDIWSQKKLAEADCFIPESVEMLRKGGSSAIPKGGLFSDFIALDHILLREAVP